MELGSWKGILMDVGGPWRNWGSLEELGVPGGAGGPWRSWGSPGRPGLWDIPTPAVTSTSLHCFPAGIFPYDLIFPWLPPCRGFYGREMIPQPKERRSRVLFPPASTRVGFCSRHGTGIVWDELGALVGNVFLVPVGTREAPARG